jgi:hypothetical protein
LASRHRTRLGLSLQRADPEIRTPHFDYQVVDNPAFNRDRGPVSVFGVRLHTQL